MTRPVMSTQLRNPGMDLMSDERQKIYTAALERRNLFLTHRDMQMRAVCEAATGVPYDSFDPSTLTFEDVKEHVAQDMSRGLSITVDEARGIVEQNYQTANPTSIKGEKAT